MIKVLSVIIIAATPLSELRGAIPVALHVFAMSPLEAVFLSLVGTMIPALAISLLLEPAIVFLAKTWPWFHRIVERRLEAARHKTKKAVDRFGLLGLIIFIAIPLPFSGVYSGAAGAILLGMRRGQVIVASLIGSLLAAGIVFSLDAGITKLF